MKLTLIGAGIRHIENLTLLSMAKMKAGRTILILGQSKGIADIVTGKKIIEINHLYKSTDSDFDNYNRIFDFVFNVIDQDMQVCLLVPGHPFLGVSLAAKFDAECARRNIAFETIEGISSFDTMINDLKIDPLEEGSVLIDVNRLLLFNTELIPQLNTFIYHISSVGHNNTNYIEPWKDNKLEQLKRYLLKFYDAEKELYFIRSEGTSDQKSKITVVAIKSLLDIAKKLDYATTLFIPAERKTEINEAFLASLRA